MSDSPVIDYLNAIRERPNDATAQLEEYFRLNDLAVFDLLGVISDPPTSDLLGLSLTIFQMLHCRIPNDPTFWLFFRLLEHPSAWIVSLSAKIIASHFRSTADLYGALQQFPEITPDLVYCLLQSAFQNYGIPPECIPLFVQAMCCPYLPFAKRREYARFLTPSNETDDPPDWRPLQVFLETFDGSDDSLRLLSILLAPEEMWPPLELSVTIASLIPHLQERFTTTRDDVLGDALECVFRAAQSALLEFPWENDAIERLVECCWILLYPTKRNLDSIDDFFATYIDSEMDDDNQYCDFPADDLRTGILYILSNGAAMRRLALLKIQMLQELDLPAVMILEYRNQPFDDIAAKIANGSPDPVWRFFAFGYALSQLGPLPEDVYVQLLDSDLWIDELIGIDLLYRTPNESIPFGVAVAAVCRGFELLNHFATDIVTVYLPILNNVIKTLLTSPDARAALASHIDGCLELGWLQLVGRGPRFCPKMAKLLSQFVRHYDFVGPFVVRKFEELYRMDQRSALDFASKFVLKAPDLLNDANREIAAALQECFEKKRWPAEVWDIAMYFALKGESGRLIEVCCHAMQEQLPVRSLKQFVSLLIVVMRVTPSDAILQALGRLVEADPRSVARTAFGVVTAASSVGKTGLNPHTALQLAHFWCENSPNLKMQSSSVDDRLMLAFLCRLLVDTAGVEGRQAVYDATMGMLNDFIDSLTPLDTTLFSVVMTHRQILCDPFPWVSNTRRDYFEHVVNGLELPDMIEAKITAVLAADT
jgi:hypothetical protein